MIDKWISTDNWWNDTLANKFHTHQSGSEPGLWIHCSFMLCCSTALHKTRNIWAVSFLVFEILVVTPEPLEHSENSVSHQVLCQCAWRWAAVPFSTATTESSWCGQIQVTSTASVNYRFPIFPQVWENTQEIMYGFVLKRMCAVCVWT